MKLNFESMWIQGFKSFVEPTLIQLNTPGLHFVRGDNKKAPRLESNGCLIGETLIDCPRDLKRYPKGIPIKELVGKQFLTYSWDSERDRLTLSPVEKVWCTGKKKIYRVKLTAYPVRKSKLGRRGGGHQDGKYLPPCELIGTFDHLVMLCDGSWRKLGELLPNDSLKSLYRSNVNDGDRGLLRWSNNVRIERRVVGKHSLKSPFVYYGLTKTVSEQQFVCEQAHGSRPLGAEVHHVSLNKHDHNPENLRWKDAKQHQSDHLRERNLEGTAGWKVTGIHPRGNAGKKRTEALNHRVESPAEFVGEEFVYDMEVERTHNFVANGVFVHNSGKSSLWDAVTWILWGRTAKGLRNPDIVPWYGDAKTRGELLISIDGKEHAIVRTADPNHLTIDGKAAGPDAVDQLLRMDFDTFINTVLYAQALPLFFDRAPRDKMQLFSEVLHLERWEEYSEAAGKRVKDLSATNAKLLEELAGVDRSMLELDELRTTTEEKRDRWEKEQAELAKDWSKKIAECEKKLIPLQNKYDKAQLDYDGAGTEAKALQREVDKTSTALREVETKLAHEEFLLKNFVDQYQQLSAELADLNEAKVCPTCGQAIQKKDLAAHKAELQKELKELQPKTNPGIMTAAAEKVEVAHKRWEQATKHRDAFREKEEKALEAVNFYRPQVDELTTAIKHYKELTQTARETTNPFTEQLQDIRRRKTVLKGQRTEIEEDKVKIERQIERAQFWIKGFKDVRLYIIEETLDELELVTNNMLEEIGLVDWRIEYIIEKETKSGTTQRGLSVFILSPDNKEPVRWESWSGGESQRLRLVGSLALSEVLLNEAGIQTNLEILDEPSRGLSARGVTDLCDFLYDRAKALNRVVFYTDHAVIENANFASVIVVTKDEKGSHVMQI